MMLFLADKKDLDAHFVSWRRYRALFLAVDLGDRKAKRFPLWGAQATPEQLAAAQEKRDQHKAAKKAARKAAKKEKAAAQGTPKGDSDPVSEPKREKQPELTFYEEIPFDDLPTKMEFLQVVTVPGVKIRSLGTARSYRLEPGRYWWMGDRDLVAKMINKRSDPPRLELESWTDVVPGPDFEEVDAGIVAGPVPLRLFLKRAAATTTTTTTTSGGANDAGDAGSTTTTGVTAARAPRGRFPVYATTEEKEKALPRSQRKKQKGVPDPTATSRKTTGDQAPPGVAVPSNIGDRIPAKTVMGESANEAAIKARGELPPNDKGYEWCHLVGHGDGGKEEPGNFVAATYSANTEQLAIEEGFRSARESPGVDVRMKVTAYTLQGYPDVADWIRYKLVDAENKKILDHKIDAEVRGFTVPQFYTLRENVREAILNHFGIPLDWKEKQKEEKKRLQEAKGKGKGKRKRTEEGDAETKRAKLEKTDEDA